MIAGQTGLLLCVGVAVFLGWLGPLFSPQLVLKMYRASRLSPSQAPQLYSLVAELARRAELPRVPALAYIPSRMLNAFATGRNPEEAVIAVTDGLVRSLEGRELAGVLAHEISHVVNRDLWVMTLADIFSRLTLFLSQFGQVLIILSLPLVLVGQARIPWLAFLILVLAPTVSTLLQLALSRVREYDADLGATKLTGDPEGLARALHKIETVQGGWLEGLFLPGRRIPVPAPLRTHPPTEERVRRLMALRGGVPAPLSHSEARRSGPGLSGPGTPPRWHWNGLWY